MIKLGTGLLTDDQNHLALDQIERIVTQIVALCQEKKQVVLVSSGAIGAGMAELGLKQRPKKLDELQAAAAIGQSKLMAVYDRLFAKFGITVAQVLLTHDDLKDRARHLNAHNTLVTLLAGASSPSSTKTTRSPWTKSNLAITTVLAHWPRRSSTRTCW